jgi:MFS family permease
MRRLLLLGSTVVFLDVAFYTAIVPLLPDYAADLHLSKAGAGVLSAAYPAGTLAASLPAGLAAARIGPRRTLVWGLALLGGASLIFGFGHHIVLLDAARLVQSVGGALAWSGALTWLIVEASDSNRGSVIGTMLGTAVAGALLGPGLGALAGEIGTEPVFSSVLVIAAALALAALRIPEHAPREEQSLGQIWATMTSRPVMRATWFVAAPSMLFGLVDVLVPLNIHDLGGGAGVVAAGFAIGAALEAGIAPVVGRASDRIGRLRPYAAGMVICAAAILLVPPAAAVAVLVAALIAFSVGAGICFTPSMAMLSDSAEATGLHQAFAAGLTNMAWASGHVIGGAGGGALARAAGDGLPCLLAAGWLLATALAAWQGGAAERQGRTVGAEAG